MCMSHILSAQPASRPSTSRIAASLAAAGRFVLHFGEMVLAMYVGMLIYMPLEGWVPSSLQQIGMAVFMAWPMVVWMRIRRHGWRHGFEMAAAMLAPWAVVMAAAQAFLPLTAFADWAMYLGMLGYMLVCRDHFTGGGEHQHGGQAAIRSANTLALHVPWRGLLLVSAYGFAVVFVPSVVGFTNLSHKYFGPGEPIDSPTYSAALPTPPTLDPNKKIAVVLSGASGSEIGDTLEAYEILARSGVFNVYSVAPERTVLPLVPGAAGPQGYPSSLDFVPHLSFAEYEAQIGAPPDLIAIPYLANYDMQRDAAVVDWIRGHFGSQTVILGICSGNMTLADTGLVAGRTATSNTGTFEYVESHSSTTTYLRNVRYVDDGNIVTSSNLTAGIDATLHVVDRFAGRARALDVARQIGYTQTAALDDPAFQPPTFSDFLMPTLLNAALDGPKQRLGVLLYDGVTELGLSGLVDPYTASGTARTFVMAPERRIVISRDGFQFLPRYDFSTVPPLDRVLLPAGENSSAKQQASAAWSATHSGQSALDIYPNVGIGETAYDASLQDLARVHNGILARAVADGLFFTTGPSDFSGAGWPVQPLLTAVALSLLGAATVFAITHPRLRRPARLQSVPQRTRPS
jgi:transcriptional regulator GlxA family with amidase domain